jgi:hypothetical protein
MRSFEKKMRKNKVADFSLPLLLSPLSLKPFLLVIFFFIFLFLFGCLEQPTPDKIGNLCIKKNQSVIIAARPACNDAEYVQLSVSLEKEVFEEGRKGKTCNITNIVCNQAELNSLLSCNVTFTFYQTIGGTPRPVETKTYEDVKACGDVLEDVCGNQCRVVVCSSDLFKTLTKKPPSPLTGGDVQEAKEDRRNVTDLLGGLTEQTYVQINAIGSALYSLVGKACSIYEITKDNINYLRNPKSRILSFRIGVDSYDKYKLLKAYSPLSSEQCVINLAGFVDAMTLYNFKNHTTCTAVYLNASDMKIYNLTSVDQLDERFMYFYRCDHGKNAGKLFYRYVDCQMSCYEQTSIADYAGSLVIPTEDVCRYKTLTGRQIATELLNYTGAWQGIIKPKAGSENLSDRLTDMFNEHPLTKAIRGMVDNGGFRRGAFPFECASNAECLSGFCNLELHTRSILVRSKPVYEMVYKQKSEQKTVATAVLQAFSHLIPDNGCFIYDTDPSAQNVPLSCVINMPKQIRHYLAVTRNKYLSLQNDNITCIKATEIDVPSLWGGGYLHLVFPSYFFKNNEFMVGAYDGYVKVKPTSTGYNVEKVSSLADPAVFAFFYGRTVETKIKFYKLDNCTLSTRPSNNLGTKLAVKSVYGVINKTGHPMQGKGYFAVPIPVTADDLPSNIYPRGNERFPIYGPIIENPAAITDTLGDKFTLPGSSVEAPKASLAFYNYPFDARFQSSNPSDPSSPFVRLTYPFATTGVGGLSSSGKFIDYYYYYPLGNLNWGFSESFIPLGPSNDPFPTGSSTVHLYRAVWDIPYMFTSRFDFGYKDTSNNQWFGCNERNNLYEFYMDNSSGYYKYVFSLFGLLDAEMYPGGWGSWNCDGKHEDYWGCYDADKKQIDYYWFPIGCDANYLHLSEDSIPESDIQLVYTGWHHGGDAGYIKWIDFILIHDNIPTGAGPQSKVVINLHRRVCENRQCDADGSNYQYFGVINSNKPPEDEPPFITSLRSTRCDMLKAKYDYSTICDSNGADRNDEAKVRRFRMPWEASNDWIVGWIGGVNLNDYGWTADPKNQIDESIEEIIPSFNNLHNTNYHIRVDPTHASSPYAYSVVEAVFTPPVGCYRYTAERLITCRGPLAREYECRSNGGSNEDKNVAKYLLDAYGDGKDYGGFRKPIVSSDSVYYYNNYIQWKINKPLHVDTNKGVPYFLHGVEFYVTRDNEMFNASGNNIGPWPYSIDANSKTCKNVKRIEGHPVDPSVIDFCSPDGVAQPGIIYSLDAFDYDRVYNNGSLYPSTRDGRSNSGAALKDIKGSYYRAYSEGKQDNANPAASGAEYLAYSTGRRLRSDPHYMPKGAGGDIFHIGSPVREIITGTMPKLEPVPRTTYDHRVLCGKDSNFINSTSQIMPGGVTVFTFDNSVGSAAAYSYLYGHPCWGTKTVDRKSLVYAPFSFITYNENTHLKNPLNPYGVGTYGLLGLYSSSSGFSYIFVPVRPYESFGSFFNEVENVKKMINYTENPRDNFEGGFHVGRACNITAYLDKVKENGKVDRSGNRVDVSWNNPAKVTLGNDHYLVKAKGEAAKNYKITAYTCTNPYLLYAQGAAYLSSTDPQFNLFVNYTPFWLFSNPRTTTPLLAGNLYFTKIEPPCDILTLKDYCIGDNCKEMYVSMVVFVYDHDLARIETPIGNYSTFGDCLVDDYGKLVNTTVGACESCGFLNAFEASYNDVREYEPQRELDMGALPILTTNIPFSSLSSLSHQKKFRGGPTGMYVDSYTKAKNVTDNCPECMIITHNPGSILPSGGQKPIFPVLLYDPNNVVVSPSTNIGDVINAIKGSAVAATGKAWGIPAIVKVSIDSAIFSDPNLVIKLATENRSDLVNAGVGGIIISGSVDRITERFCAYEKAFRGFTGRDVSYVLGRKPVVPGTIYENITLEVKNRRAMSVVPESQCVNHTWFLQNNFSVVCYVKKDDGSFTLRSISPGNVSLIVRDPLLYDIYAPIIASIARNSGIYLCKKGNVTNEAGEVEEKYLYAYDLVPSTDISGEAPITVPKRNRASNLPACFIEPLRDVDILRLTGQSLENLNCYVRQGCCLDTRNMNDPVAELCAARGGSIQSNGLCSAGSLTAEQLLCPSTATCPTPQEPRPPSSITSKPEIIIE